MCDENVNFSTLVVRVLNYTIAALLVISSLIITDFYQRFFIGDKNIAYNYPLSLAF